MKIIVPMAGRGSRLRPHTLTIPKPLIPIAGKSIVQRLIEEIYRVVKLDIEEIAFITGDFGEQINNSLKKIANSVGSKASIYRQDEPLGTAHAIYCAQKSLYGPCVVAFADTLFKAEFELNNHEDGVIWVKKVKNPSTFGVVKLDEKGIITEFIEKSKTFISDLAIIGIYYFKDGENLKSEIKYLLDNNIKLKGEFQLTNALENMKSKGKKFYPGAVSDWMDCGNKKATIETNSKILKYEAKNEELISDSAQIVNSQIVQPCYIGTNAKIKNSIIGPFVSVGESTKIENCSIDKSLIQNHAEIINANITNSMIGNYAIYKGVRRSISLGDYSCLDF